MVKPINQTKTTPVQRKYLRERVRGNYGPEAPKQVPEPAGVRRAREHVKKWDDAQRRKRDEPNAVFRRERDATIETILFAAPAEALAAVKEFERKYPPRRDRF